MATIEKTSPIVPATGRVNEPSVLAVPLYWASVRSFVAVSLTGESLSLTVPAGATMLALPDVLGMIWIDATFAASTVGRAALKRICPEPFFTAGLVLSIRSPDCSFAPVTVMSSKR